MRLKTFLLPAFLLALSAAHPPLVPVPSRGVSPAQAAPVPLPGRIRALLADTLAALAGPGRSA